MSLPPAEPRQPVHTRTIRCQGFKRADGLWDIDGQLSDTRAEPMQTLGRGHIESGEHLHEMWIRMTVDEDLRIVAIQAKTVLAPYPGCANFPQRFEKLIGVRIESGWTARVRLVLGGPMGCAHLVELLGPLASTAVQTIHAWRGESVNQSLGTAAPPPDLLNSCHALAEGGEIAKRLWPDQDSE